MADQYFSRRNLDFTLYEVLDATALTEHAFFAAHDRSTFDFTLDAATQIAAEIVWPAYAASDRNPPELEDGQVRVHPAIHQFYRAFSESGLLAATFPQEWEGQQLPKCIGAAVGMITGGAVNAFIMFPDLTKGAADLILHFGSAEQKALFLPKMLRGEWSGTMCLTETQAGSSLSDVVTKATPQPDGTYQISGQKIFISAGDQDITDNILHLVLARIEGAPKGIKGISLFIVPKYRIEDFDTFKRVSNDVTSIGIYHKMGQKATPAMHLEFGANGGCTGYLVGEAHQGLKYMFQMMNDARLGVGLAGMYVATGAYYAALQYARERTQGRRANAKDPNEPPVPILQHPDVRRMLLAQKAFAEGALAFILQCYQYLDLRNVSTSPADKQRYDDLLELLTPVAKTYGSEMGNVSVSLALQVLGGYGYTEDFPLEQMARDARIFPLYEGTTGIQAQALLGRQLVRNGGQAVQLWLDEIQPDLELARQPEALKPYAVLLEEAIDHWKTVTARLLGLAGKDPEVFLSDATLYMEYFGILNIAWQWLRQANVAHKALTDKHPDGEEALFYRSKIQTMRYFFHYELPKTRGLAARLADETVLTLFDANQEILL